MDFTISIPWAILATLGTACVTLTCSYLIYQYTARQRRIDTESSLRAENQALQKAMAILEKRHAEEVLRYQIANAELQKEVLDAQAKYNRKHSHQAILEKYNFSHWGTSVIGRDHFCTHCLSVEPQLEIQLAEHEKKMTCPHCKTVYHSPYKE